MKLTPIAFAALLLLTATGLSAPVHAWDDGHLRLSCDAPTRWASRHDARDARLAITSNDGEVQLILTDRVVAVQLSDRTLREIRRETRKELNDEEDHPIAQAIKTAVLTGVRAVLNHSAECPIRELRDADYRDGRLVLATEDGDRIFSGLEIDDVDLLESFSAADSRAFVQEFRRVKARRR